MSRYNDYVNTNTPLSPTEWQWITPEEKAAGIDNKLKVAARRYLCPTCGREFSLFQSRAVACKFCPKASSRCPYVRCPYCDNEFPIDGFIVPQNDRQGQRIMQDYADLQMNKWAESYNRH